MWGNCFIALWVEGRNALPEINKVREKIVKVVSNHVVRKKIPHYDYIQCLKQAKTSFCKQTQIAQEKNQLYTVQQNKFYLSPFNYKRYLKDDGINSYAYCHIEIEGDECTEFFCVIVVWMMCACVYECVTESFTDSKPGWNMRRTHSTHPFQIFPTWKISSLNGRTKNEGKYIKCILRTHLKVYFNILILHKM